MVEVAEELVEAVDGGQELIQVTQVVLAELAGSIAHGFERCRNGRCFRRHPDRRAGLTNGSQASAYRQLAGDEVGATSSTGRLSIVIGEAHSLGGEFVEVRRLARHDALVVGADIKPTDVVAHDNYDVRRLSDRLC